MCKTCDNSCTKATEIFISYNKTRFCFVVFPYCSIPYTPYILITYIVSYHKTYECMANCSGVTRLKFNTFLPDVQRSSAALTRASTLRTCDPSMPCVMPAHRMKLGYDIFAKSSQKLVTIATSLERSQKARRNDHTHPYVYLT